MRDPFPLTFLGWGDFSETYLDEWQDQTTPLESLERLFASPVMNNLRMLQLRNPQFSDGQLKPFARKWPELQLLVVRDESHYIRAKNERS